MDPDSDDAVASPRSQSAGEFSHAHIWEGRCRMTTPPKPMVWVKADSADMEGKAPSARSGHTAVAIGKSKLILFGGFADKKFLSGIFVYDVEKRLWYTPKCSGVGFYRQAEPSPRAFHIAACIGSDMFIFGGRSGAKSLGDSWVLNTDVWRWSELRCSGDLPCPRQFAATAVIGGNKIIVHGGWDGNKGLSDTYIFDTSVLQWKKLLVDGLLPPPRCGHAAIVIDKRLLIYGGRGGNGVIMGDLWALKGTYEKDNERASWTQFNLPEQAYSARSGHSVTSSGSHLLLFGGHGTQSSPSGCDIYHNECIILYRGFTKWESFRTINEPPPPRAYHSLTCTGLRFLLFGGFDGINTFGDMWWLVSEDDPIAKRDMVPKAESDSTDVQKFALMESDVTQSDRIMLYIYKHFEQKGYNICFSLRRILFNGMYIIPSARCQLPV